MREPLTEVDRRAGDPGEGAHGSTMRWLAAAVVTGLLVATVAAFVETERLKLTPSPILDTVVSKTFAPTCSCSTGWADIAFRLRRRNLMTVEVIAMDGRPVRRLAAREFSAGFVHFVWYGLSGGDQAAPEATKYESICGPSIEPSSCPT